jgi:hypothetical protein
MARPKSLKEVLREKPMKPKKQKKPIKQKKPKAPSKQQLIQQLKSRGVRGLTTKSKPQLLGILKALERQQPSSASAPSLRVEPAEYAMSAPAPAPLSAPQKKLKFTSEPMEIRIPASALGQVQVEPTTTVAKVPKRKLNIPMAEDEPPKPKRKLNIPKAEDEPPKLKQKWNIQIEEPPKPKQKLNIPKAEDEPVAPMVEDRPLESLTVPVLKQLAQKLKKENPSLGGSPSTMRKEALIKYLRASPNKGPINVREERVVVEEVKPPKPKQKLNIPKAEDEPPKPKQKFNIRKESEVERQVRQPITDLGPNVEKKIKSFLPPDSLLSPELASLKEKIRETVKDHQLHQLQPTSMPVATYEFKDSMPASVFREYVRSVWKYNKEYDEDYNGREYTKKTIPKDEEDDMVKVGRNIYVDPADILEDGVMYVNGEVITTYDGKQYASYPELYQTFDMIDSAYDNQSDEMDDILKRAYLIETNKDKDKPLSFYTDLVKDIKKIQEESTRYLDAMNHYPDALRIFRTKDEQKMLLERAKAENNVQDQPSREEDISQEEEKGPTE